MADGIEGELAGLGPFFLLDRISIDARPAAPWRSVAELTVDPQVLGDRVAGVRAGLAERSGRPPGEVPVRIAASVTHLGLLARLLSPLLGLAVLDHRPATGTPPAGFEALWWQGPLAGIFPLWLAGVETEIDRAPSILMNDLVGLTETVGRRWRVSTQVLWGNVASAANGIATQVTAARPDLAGPIRSVAAELARGLPRARLFDGMPGVGFRRRTCCLLVHAWPADNAAEVRCGDCVLNRNGGRLRTATPGG